MKITMALFLCPLLSFGQVKAGDSILITQRALQGITPDYTSTDEWSATMWAYIPRMAGRKYEIHKVARGYIFLRVRDILMNDWTPMKFKVDANMLEDSSIVLVKKP